jgi:hypothetical protein
MPRHDFSPRLPRADAPGRSFTPGFGLAPLALAMKLLRRRKSGDPGHGGVPAEPDRPNTLTGGAAAPLELDDE